MHNRIYVFGASCSGSTTLGRGLSQALSIPHADSDDYFWEQTDPPFSIKRPEEERVRLMAPVLGDGSWVLTGACENWARDFIADATLIVFLSLPQELRLQRLKQREQERFGDRILEGGDMFEIHEAFFKWASQYEDPEFTGRSRHRHEAWMKSCGKPALRLDGRLTREELVTQVLRISA
ncbi:AAA family ATPase [Pseudovibrio sp. FO-BEG1]|uniref:AAA family ATPase n=1 Tax=Pseudovibrio sp. (strain FO-BEG1) TaxID=911045 RepID=UPI0005A1A2E1|nr:AAA family ATPase [Pseudovibrio sp. FO-BEG1]